MNTKTQPQSLQRLKAQAAADKAAASSAGDNDDGRSLADIARALFAQQITEFPLPARDDREAKVVTFLHARMKQLPEAMAFFERITTRLDPTIITEIVVAISERQVAARNEGKPFNAFDLSGLGNEDIVHKALGKTTIFLAVMNAVITELPTLAPVFTNLSSEEFGDLDPDEGMIVALGIFVVNYRFFIRNLLPTLMGSLGNIASKNAEKSK